MIGETFGRLKVIAFGAGKIETNGTVSKTGICLCECGTTKEVRCSALKNGITKSCGCILKDRVKSVIGQEYGQLKIIDIAPKLNNREKRVKVECSCGVKKDVNYRELIRGKTISCGCYSKSKHIDIEKEKIYGKLEILKEVLPYVSPMGDKSRKVLCKCECGNEKEYVLQTLRQGIIKDCGCVFKNLLEEKRSLKEIKYIEPIPEDTEDEKWKILPIRASYLISSRGRLFCTKKRIYRDQTKSSHTISTGDGELTIPIAETVYKIFISDYVSSDYHLLFIDENTRNFNKDNLFLAAITENGKNWVQRLYENCKANGVKKPGQRLKNKRDFKIGHYTSL